MMGQEVVDYGSTVNDGTGDPLHVAMAKLDLGARSFTILDKDLSAPPGSPAIGAGYIVAATPTGAWAGQAKSIAVFGLSGWLFIAPFEGMRAYATDENVEYRYDSAAWVVLSSSSSWGSITGTLSAQTDLQSALDGKQPVDSDLTTIAGLTATTDNFMQAKAGAWASRTVAQVKSDLSLSGANTGDQTITLTGDVTGSGTGSFAATIANDSVTNGKLGNMATATLKGRVTGSTGDPEDLTGTQATTLLDAFTSALKGLAPASGGGTTNYLRADGTWAAPPGASAVAWGGITGTLSAQTDLQSALDGKQPIDSDLTTLSGLTATTDNFIQSKAGAWASRTVAQVKSDLGISGTISGTNTGDQTITLTGDVTGSGAGFFAATIANDAVTNAKLANVATATIKGRVTASTGDPEDLTGTQATTLLDAFTSALKGLAPASGGGTTNFLRADGTWAKAATSISLSLFAAGLATASEVIFAHPAGVAYTLPSSLTGSQFAALTAATASTTFTIKKNGSSIGTLVWAAAGTVPTVTFSSSTAFAIGDLLTITGPASPDATLAGIYVTLIGTI